jgi:hypothetical protein
VKKLGRQAVHKYVSSPRSVAALGVEVVENLVEVVDNSPYQEL